MGSASSNKQAENLEIIHHTYEGLHLFFTDGSWDFSVSCYFALGWHASIGGIGLPKKIDLFFFILQLFIVESGITSSSSIKQCSEDMDVVPVVLLFSYNHYVICNDNDILYGQSIDPACIWRHLLLGSSKWHDCVPEVLNLSIKGS